MTRNLLNPYKAKTFYLQTILSLASTLSIKREKGSCRMEKRVHDRANKTDKIIKICDETTQIKPCLVYTKS